MHTGLIADVDPNIQSKETRSSPMDVGHIYRPYLVFFLPLLL